MILGYSVIEDFKKEVANNKGIIYDNLMKSAYSGNTKYIRENISKIDINLKDDKKNSFLDLIVTTNPEKKVLDLFLNDKRLDKTNLEKTLLYSSQNNDIESFENIFNKIDKPQNLNLNNLLEITNDRQILKIILENKEFQKQISMKLFKDLEQHKGSDYTIEIINQLKEINPDIIVMLLNKSLENNNKKAFNFLLEQVNEIDKVNIVEILNVSNNLQIDSLLNNDLFKLILQKDLTILDKNELRLDLDLEEIKFKLNERKIEDNNIKF